VLGSIVLLLVIKPVWSYSARLKSSMVLLCFLFIVWQLARFEFIPVRNEYGLVVSHLTISLGLVAFGLSNNIRFDCIPVGDGSGLVVSRSTIN
jgi:hypothetical protein